jgi:hypothetical protein
MDAPNSDIDLTRAVAAVRDQLMEAAAQGGDERIRFAVGPIQLEFTVELRIDVTAKAGVRAWIFNADASAGRSSAHTHKVSLTLTPRDAESGGEILVGNEKPASTELFGPAH